MPMTLQAQSELIADIYDAATGSVPWDEVIARIRTTFTAKSAALLVASPDAHPVSHDSGMTDDSRRTYTEHYGALDPVAAFMRSAPAEVAVGGGRFLAEEVRKGSEFLDDWVRPLGIGTFIAGKAQQTGAASEWIVLASHSVQRRFDEPGNIRALQLLLPHLRRALRLHTQLHDDAAMRDDLATAFDHFTHALAILSDHGTIILANHVMERTLTDGDALTRDRSGRLLTRRSSIASAIERLIALATRGDSDGVRRGGSVTVPRASGLRALIVHVVPIGHDQALPGSALLAAVDPELKAIPPGRMLRAVFGLTPAEAETALRVLTGTGLKAVADLNGVTLSTVRVQLQAVFRKTRTHRQSDLAALLLDVGGGISDRAGR